MRWNRTVRDRIAGVVFALLVVTTAVTITWLMRQAWAVHRLTRGIGELNYDPKTTPTPSLVIIVKPLEEPAARVFNDGIRISLVP